ncbi:hypothetical protein EMIHUDRAFT_243922 [Emiliania huxleyi CCMP1516]|uniref:Uncharacterized protein n=2 Tax=Emiliania huxleyi TaxID=2903 RepID=A0A0D3J287_EMIH1|nr:hypothetical protein EMIHUDRAFT_243922 [Emiliania huxleyi CCMP1516]EOD17622.1 hypothetical protein EMIHUDRAFT_243922 [Emiliania huxleyi CCMP1516]|eukprot:XP_005770051.1 hypothetical protein EMIHUDRAFT_243922 [Emiliania huxleyi CCMP1516]
MQRAAKTPRRSEPERSEPTGAVQTVPRRRTGPPLPTKAARAAARAVGPDSRLSSMLSDTQKLASRLRGELRTLRGEAARLRGEAAAAARTYGWLLREYSASRGRPGLLAIERAANVISCTPRALAQLCGMLAQSRIAET